MVKKFLQFELWVVKQFNNWCQSPHWFFFWFVFFFVFTIWREFIPHPWYTDNIDLLVIAWTSAFIPFYVENAMKATQREQLHQQEEQMKILKQQQEAVLQLAQINQELAKKILASVNDVQEDLHDLAEAGEEEPHDKG